MNSLFVISCGDHTGLEIGAKCKGAIEYAKRFNCNSSDLVHWMKSVCFLFALEAAVVCSHLVASVEKKTWLVQESLDCPLRLLGGADMDSGGCLGT